MRGSRFGRRGAATVEAVVLLPLLLLLLFAIIHVHRTRDAALRATARARSCAMEFASKGCRQVPPHCAGVLTQSEGTPDDRIVREVASETSANLRPLGGVRSGMGSIGSFPFVGDAITGLFGSRARGAVSIEVDGHTPGRRRAFFVRGSFSLACNGAIKTGGGVADELFSAIFD